MYLTRLNANADCAMTSETPSADAITCTNPPNPVPIQEASPSFRPPDTVRATTYAIPGPGVIAKATAAIKNGSNDIDFSFW